MPIMIFWLPYSNYEWPIRLCGCPIAKLNEIFILLHALIAKLDGKTYISNTHKFFQPRKFKRRTNAIRIMTIDTSVFSTRVKHTGGLCTIWLFLCNIFIYTTNIYFFVSSLSVKCSIKKLNTFLKYEFDTLLIHILYMIFPCVGFRMDGRIIQQFEVTAGYKETTSTCALWSSSSPASTAGSPSLEH